MVKAWVNTIYLTTARASTGRKSGCRFVIVPPSGLNPAAVVDETVSLRDLPATIVDLAGQGNGSPFPGESLARFWRTSPPNGRWIAPRTAILLFPS